MNKTSSSFGKLLDEKLKDKRFPIAIITFLMILGVAMSFSHNSSPAPFIPSMIGYFNLDPVMDQSLINLSMSIMFISTIPATFIGTYWEQKLGTRRLFTLAMLFTCVGVLMVFLSSLGYGVFLTGRVIYGFGFGLALPFLGSAIMSWFRPRGRQIMTTLNGIFPLLGALLSYTFFPILGGAYGGAEGLSSGWIFGYGFSGFIVLAVIVIWIITVRKDVDKINIAAEEEKFLGIKQHQEKEKQNVVLWALKTNQIRCIIACFMCDFMMYMYIATVLPIWLINAGGMSEVMANTWTAIAFPVFGVIGVTLGGILTNVLGKRKPIVLFCQVLKLIGIIVATLGSDISTFYIIFGVALFGLGNGGWMSAMYIIPTEIPGTNASKVAASYSVFNSLGFVAGLIMPVVGGVIATNLIGSSGITNEAAQLAYGYKWSVLILGLFHIIAIISAIKLKETGLGRKKKELEKAA
ncbi:MAG: MFS transporter [Bacillota bacterium]|jgi:MFS family permease